MLPCWANARKRKRISYFQEDIRRSEMPRRPPGEARGCVPRRYCGSGRSWAPDLKDLQIAGRVGKRVTESRLDPPRRERVELLTVRFRKIELSRSDPCTGNG